MIVPGSNLFKMAASVIHQSTVGYRAFVSRTGNNVGLLESTFAPSVDIRGSFQPVPRTMYDRLGLDYTKNYAMFYSAQPINDVSRDRTGDQLDFNGKVWQVESSNDWQAIDGWNGVLCIEVTEEPTP
jgi:hypothetical protein